MAYTSNFYIAIALAIVALFIIFLLVYLVFFKKPNKNKFDPKELPVESKPPVKKKVVKGSSKNPVFMKSPPMKPVTQPMRRPMPGYNQNSSKQKP